MRGGGSRGGGVLASCVLRTHAQVCFGGGAASFSLYLTPVIWKLVDVYLTETLISKVWKAKDTPDLGRSGSRSARSDSYTDFSDGEKRPDSTETPFGPGSLQVPLLKVDGADQ